MSNVYITGFTKIDFKRSAYFEPKVRFVRYFEDLYSLYNDKASIETFYQGGQYTFVEIGKALLDKCQKMGWLQKLDILIPTHWAYEYDTDYTHCGTFLKQYYRLKCDIFDVCEQGTLTVFTVINIIYHYLTNAKLKKAIVLALEQTTIPRNVDKHVMLPVNNGGRALLIENNEKVGHADVSFKIIYSSIISSAFLMDSVTFLDNLLDHFSTKKTQNHLYFISKKNSNITKKIMFKLHRQSDLIICQLGHLSSNSTMFNTLDYLGAIFKNANNLFNAESIYLLIIDEAVESFDVGILLLKLTD